MRLSVGDVAELKREVSVPASCPDDKQVGPVRGAQEDPAGVPLGGAPVHPQVRRDVPQRRLKFLGRTLLVQAGKLTGHQRMVDGLARGGPPGPSMMMGPWASPEGPAGTCRRAGAGRTLVPQGIDGRQGASHEGRARPAVRRTTGDRGPTGPGTRTGPGRCSGRATTAFTPHTATDGSGPPRRSRRVTRVPAPSMPRKAGATLPHAAGRTRVVYGTCPPESVGRSVAGILDGGIEARAVCGRLPRLSRPEHSRRRVPS